MPTTIAVIGGNGKAGRYLVRELLKQNHQLRLLLRHSEQFPPQDPRIEVITGDVRDTAAVASLLQNSHAMISTLGQPKDEATPIFSQAACILSQACEKHLIKRCILLTGLSIDLPGDRKSERVAGLSAYMRQAFPAIIADKQKEYEMWRDSAAEWTLVRVPLIVPAEDRTDVRISLEDCPGEMITAADLASFLADQLNDDRFLRQSPFVASAMS